MALHAASYASSAVAPTASGLHSYGTLALDEDALPEASHPSLARDPALSSGLPLAYANPIQSFPMVSPALSVMVPAIATGQIFHRSPIASQVCVSHMRAVQPPQQCRAHDTLLCCLLQADVLAMRLMQDIAFQQAVQTSHVLAAAKAAVSLLGVRLCTRTSCTTLSNIVAAYPLLTLPSVSAGCLQQ